MQNRDPSLRVYYRLKCTVEVSELALKAVSWQDKLALMELHAVLARLVS